MSSTPCVRIRVGAGKSADGIAGILTDEAGDAAFPADGASGLQFAANTIGDMASVYDLLFTLEAITAAGAGFRSLTEAVDTTTAAGRLMTQTLGAFAEFERAMNGLAHARSAGRLLGRRPSLTAPQRAEIIAKAESGQGSPSQLASLFRVSRSTVQRVLREHRESQLTKAKPTLSKP
nr:recombinase family protein [Sphingomonas sp. CFBP 8760]